MNRRRDEDGRKGVMVVVTRSTRTTKRTKQREAKRTSYNKIMDESFLCVLATMYALDCRSA